MIRFQIHPQAIIFEEKDCHVILETIKNNQETIEFLKNVFPENKIRLFTEIFNNTIRLVFIPTEEEKIFYKNILIAEKNKLEKASAKNFKILKCPNCNQNHLEIIEKIAKKLKIDLIEN